MIRLRDLRCLLPALLIPLAVGCHLIYPFGVEAPPDAGSVQDGGTPDLDATASDGPGSDVPASDAPVSDTSGPDTVQSDTVLPDMVLSDTVPPDTAAVDQGVVMPTELCNFKDDDGDMAIDEDGACHYSGWTGGGTFTSTVRRLAFINAKIGVALTSSWIQRTTDGGASWTKLVAPTFTALGLATHPAGLVLIVGTNGKILRSVNFGANFSAVSSGTTSTLYGVAITDGHNAVAVGAGGIVRRSADGGQTWGAGGGTGTTSNLLDVAARPGSNSLLAVGSGGVIRLSSNNGITWTISSSPSKSNLDRVAYSLSGAVVVGAGGTVLRATTYPPITFTAVTLPGSVSGTLEQVVAPAADSFVIKGPGSSGTFYLSIDSGKSFVQRSMGSGSFDALAARSPTALVALGPSGTRIGEGPVRWIGGEDDFVFRSVAYDNGSSASMVALAASASGRLYRTSNDGQSWERVYVPTAASLYGVSRYGTTALAVGYAGQIFRSTDTGQSWTPVKSGTTSTLYGVALYSSHAVAVGSNKTILRSTDGGATWSPATSPGSGNNTLWGVTFKNATAIAVGDGGYIARSADHGGAWSLRTSGTSTTLYGVHFDYDKPTSPALAVGELGTIVRSADNGLTWSSVASGTTNALYGAVVGGTSSSYAVAVGAVGTILRSSNAGSSWSSVPSGTGSHLVAVTWRYGSTSILAAGYNATIARSADYGASWTPYRKGTPTLTVRAADDQGADTVVVGDSGYAARTANGTSWNYETTGSGQSLYGLAHAGSTLVAVGLGGAIRRCVSPTSGWFKVSSGLTTPLRGVAAPSSTSFVAVGDGGQILRSTNSGGSFSNVTSGTSATLNSVDCFGSTCLAAGNGGALHRSTNSGSTWGSASAGVSGNLYAVRLASATSAVAGGDGGALFYTSNGAASWTQGQSPVTSPVRAVHALGGARWLAATEDGRLLASGDGGASWSSHAPRQSSALLAISTSGNVKLIVGESALQLSYAPVP